jgi:hypothetical protein
VEGRWQLDCGHVEWDEAAKGAAEGGHVECLQFALDQGAHLQSSLLCDAAQGRSLAMLEYLLRAGCVWTGDEGEAAAAGGDPEVLAFCLRHAPPRDWNLVMEAALGKNSQDCVRVLYTFGYEQHRSRQPSKHPACRAVTHGSLECLQLAVRHSGPPLSVLAGWTAGRAGKDMLSCVLEVGGELSKGAARGAISASDVASLEFAFQHGVPCDRYLIWSALWANSLECLRCVYKHAVGLRLEAEDAGRVDKTVVLDPAIVLYVAKDMDPHMAYCIMRWMARGWEFTAEYVRTYVDRYSGELCYGEGWYHHVSWKEEPFNWWTALLLARWFGREPMPKRLHQLVAVRRERAAALAGAFYKAGKLAQEETPSPSLPLWRALAALPSELRERIAFQAHLVAPLHESFEVCVQRLGPLQPSPMWYEPSSPCCSQWWPMVINCIQPWLQFKPCD